MKEIGIVSRVHGVNYGANLQALALQTAIEKEPNIHVEYINFKVNPTNRGFHKILSSVYSYVSILFGSYVRASKTEQFRAKYLHLSQKITSLTDSSQFEKYNILISGSDQIWNPRYYPLAKGFYLLDIPSNAERYSYSSSFGIVDIPENIKKIYKDALQKFKYISVRENRAVEMLKELGFDNVRQDIDPTLLLSSDEWKRFFSLAPIIKDKYICCYVMSGDTRFNNYIIRNAERLQNNLPDKHKIVIIGDKEYRGIFSKHHFCPTAGPEDFLNYIFNAEYVITSSFHGTCFSIIFKKQFTTILRKDNPLNSRAESLLDLVHLRHHLKYEESNVQFLNDDYCGLDEKINNLRINSNMYLRNLLAEVDETE